MSFPIKEYSYMIIAVDFDGTVVEHDWPNIGALKPNAVKVLRYLSSQGHKLIIWTCRTKNNPIDGRDTYAEAYQFMLDNNIPFDAFNDNVNNRFGSGSYPKVFADVYIDDKQLGGIPNDWNDILTMLRTHHDVL